jgi:hypothetical protein
MSVNSLLQSLVSEIVKLTQSNFSVLTPVTNAMKEIDSCHDLQDHDARRIALGNARDDDDVPVAFIPLHYCWSAPKPDVTKAIHVTKLLLGTLFSPDEVYSLVYFLHEIEFGVPFDRTSSTCPSIYHAYIHAIADWEMPLTTTLEWFVTTTGVPIGQFGSSLLYDAFMALLPDSIFEYLCSHGCSPYDDNIPHAQPLLIEGSKEDKEWRASLTIGSLVDCQDSEGSIYNGQIVGRGANLNRKMGALFVSQGPEGDGRSIDQLGIASTGWIRSHGAINSRWSSLNFPYGSKAHHSLTTGSNLYERAMALSHKHSSRALIFDISIYRPTLAIAMARGYQQYSDMQHTWIIVISDSIAVPPPIAMLVLSYCGHRYSWGAHRNRTIQN